MILGLNCFGSSMDTFIVYCGTFLGSAHFIRFEIAIHKHELKNMFIVDFFVVVTLTSCLFYSSQYSSHFQYLSNISPPLQLKLMIPAYASNNHCQWVYSINYGGGLVSGDEVSLEIEVEEGCAALLTSQGSTKV